MEWVILAAVVLVVALGGLGLALRTVKKRAPAPAPPPEPVEPEPVAPPTRPKLAPEEEVARALASHLEEAQETWFRRLERECPVCDALELRSERSNPRPHEDRVFGGDLIDIAYDCGSCGWHYERRGVLDRDQPHPGHWRALVGPMRAPPSAWTLGDGEGRPVARLTVGGGLPTKSDLLVGSQDRILSAARTLIETAIRVDGAPLPPTALIAAWRKAVKDALPFGEVLDVAVLEDVTEPEPPPESRGSRFGPD
ncbi:MAG: hypothetical protein H6742_03775 [Alphaproteobacteria bacterium]|nr:hypothetical protein [Alphaproteobacteria bacterium]